MDQERAPALHSITRTAAAALLGLAAQGCAVLPKSGFELSPEAAGLNCRTVYVVSNGFHTAVALPAEDAAKAGFASAGAPWMEVGWGEHRAFRAEKLKVGTVLAAAFAPGTTTLHLAPLPARPDVYYGPEGVTAVAVSEAGLATLSRELGEEAERDAAGGLIPLGPGKAPGANFVKARSAYRPWRTCNVWTAERLRSAGVSVRPRNAVLASSLTEALAKRPGCSHSAVDD